jgi:glycosyltransferase involved in cell wall biosynthesis
MLTSDRPAMAKRAVESFRAQTYPNRRLLILDTSDSIPADAPPWVNSEDGMSRVVNYRNLQGQTIGKLRNYSNECAAQYIRCEILLHMDDDDVSHPNRIAEQVALLQDSGADAVGYNQVLFWRTVRCIRHYVESCEQCSDAGLDGDAWLYTNRSLAYCCGASLAYWRRTWERHPFPNLQVGEDNAFQQAIRDAGGRTVAVTALPSMFQELRMPPECEPRLIQSLHGGNTAAQVDPASDMWRRVPEWDEFCRKECTL